MPEYATWLRVIHASNDGYDAVKDMRHLAEHLGDNDPNILAVEIKEVSMNGIPGTSYRPGRDSPPEPAGQGR